VNEERPASSAEAADMMRTCLSHRAHVRVSGGRTKAGWGHVTPEPDTEISTAGMARVLEHNAGDLTAVVQAGVTLARAQEVFAEEGQMFALDPPLGRDDAATIGGILATADTGPLRHRHGGARDLVVGVTVALSDGTLARSGGKVIKNVAGYDLAKLLSGSFGTLGMITELSLRLHPRPERTATAALECDRPEALERASFALAHSTLEAMCLDVAWGGNGGKVMARFGGAAPEPRAGAAASLLEEFGDATTIQDDAGIWEEIRSRQRSEKGAIVRIGGLPSELARISRAVTRTGGSFVGRGALGVMWAELPGGDPRELVGRIEDLRHDLDPFPCVVLDASGDVRKKVDVWGGNQDSSVELMRRIKARFDPQGLCNPGVFVAGI
jgi:glycolate oxidase FAD binding subunit